MAYLGKKIFAFTALYLSALTAWGASPPAVGLWEKYPVGDPSLKLVARTDYVFTNIKLDEATIFTGLNPIGSAISVICCIVVKNTKALSVDDVVKKYAVDPGFVEQIRSVKGLKYMYEAESADKSIQNDYFRTITRADNDPTDLSAFSVAVVGAKLEGKKRIDHSFILGADKVSLKVRYPKNKSTVNYEFKVNGEAVEFSEVAPVH